jgi:hypothetical protein
VGLFGGTNRVLPPARQPARGRPTPRVAPRPRQRPPRAAPQSSIRRPLALLPGHRSPVSRYSWYRRYQLYPLSAGLLSHQASDDSTTVQTTTTPKANVQGTYFAVASKWHHISPLRRCLGQLRRHLRWSAAVSRPSCTEDHQTIAPFRR